MARQLQRATIRSFLGIATNGESRNQPLRQINSIEFGAYCSEAKNVHFPAGRLTNKDVGYIAQGTAPAAGAGAAWDFLGFLDKSDGNAHQFGIANAKLFDQGDLTGTFTEATLQTGVTISAGSEWSGSQYFDGFYMANGVNQAIFWAGGTGGGNEVERWQITGPAAAPTLLPQTAGAITVNQGWKYAYSYFRSDDGFESPISAISDTGAFTSMQEVKVSVVTSGDSGVDKIRIYRTSDGGATLRLLATITDSTGDHLDTVLDASLGLVATTMDQAIDPFTFNMVTVSGDRIYVAGITEDSERRTTRVRWSFPGQPYRFDAFDFSDDIDGEIIALVGGEFGVYAFTAQTVYLIRDVGNGVHVVDPTDLPGTYHRRSVVYAQGVLAWLSGRSVFSLLPGQRSVTNISDPAGIGSSIETILEGVTDRNQIWLSYHGELRYIIVGLARDGASAPTVLLAFDVERQAWWEMEYAGVWATQVRRLTGEKQTNKLLLGTSAGATIEAYNGQGAGTIDVAARTGLLIPKIVIGSTNFFLGNKKDFSAVDWFFAPKGANRMQSSYDIDRQSIVKKIQGSFPSEGDPLSTGPPSAPVAETFILGQGKLASTVNRRFRQGIHRRGYMAKVTLEGLDSQEMQLIGVTVEYQVEP